MSGYSTLSKEQLIAEIKRLKKGKKFGLLWEDKPEDVAELCKTKLPVLVDVPEREISDGPHDPTNILIEGDNYHALSVLNYTHKGKIDVIYIDPPYNTGNRDFKYNDKWVDLEDGYRHSKWVSFMQKRLSFARNLLSDEGVIFIAIDENEYAHLKILCDEIFDAKNYRNTIILRRYDKNLNRQFIEGGLASYNIGFESVLVYSRNTDTRLNPVFRQSSEDRQNNGYWKGFWNSADRPTMRYNLLGVLPTSGQWKWKKGTALEAVKNYEDYLAKYAKKMTLEKYWLKTGKIKKFIRRNTNGNGANKGVEHWIPQTDEVLRNSNWSDLFASKPIKEFGVEFDNPKDYQVIKEFIKISPVESPIVLDFFAGSGTTGHSVSELNKEDGKCRQFILCTNNENNICSDVCYPRIKKVITGYKATKGKKIDGLGGNLKYFRTDFVNADPTDKNKKKLTEMATEMLCLKEGTFEKITSKKAFKIYKNTNHYTGIIFDQIAIPDFKEAIAKLKGKFSVYVFSLGDDSFEDEFKDIEQKVKLSPIPEVILRVYRRIFK